MFERYTEEARRVLFFARFEVTQHGGRSIEPEHLVLGLLRVPGTIHGFLQSRGLSAEGLRAGLEAKLQSGERFATSVEIPFADRAKRVLAFACEEADRLAHAEIGTEHLMLGLLREEHEDQTRVLTGHGLRLDEARNGIFRLRAESAGTAPNAGPELRRAVLRHIAESELLLGQIMKTAGHIRDVNELAAALFLELEALRDSVGPEPSA